MSKLVVDCCFNAFHGLTFMWVIDEQGPYVTSYIELVTLRCGYVHLSVSCIGRCSAEQCDEILNQFFML